MLVDEILSLLLKGNYAPVYCHCKELHVLEEEIKKGHIDLIISDFDLPETLRTTIERTHKTYAAHVPLIYLVGEKNEIKAAESLKRGVWDYVLKTRFVKLVPTIYSSQKYGKVLKYSRQVKEDYDKQEALTRLLIESDSDPTLIIDKDWKIRFTNNQMAERLHLPDADFKTSINNLISSSIDQNGNPHEEFISILKKEKPLTDSRFFIGFIRSHGGIDYGYLTIRNVYSEDLNEELTILVFRDITELRQMELDLMESESKYQSIFNTVQDGMILIDPQNYDILDFNESIKDIFLVDGSLSKEATIQFLAEENTGCCSESIEKVIKKLGDEKSITYLDLSKRFNGEEFWTENTMSKFSIGDSDKIILVIRDIQEQKILEDSLKKSREHFRNLAENSPDVIMRFDKNYRHLYVNQTIEEQIGLKVETFINRSHEEMGVFPEDLLSIWHSAMKQVFETGKNNTIFFDLNGSNGVKSYEWRLFPEKDADGSVNTLLTIARDITESKLSNQALELSEERLQQAVQATSLGLWDWNLRNNEVYYSPLYMEMLGYEPDELPQELSTWEDLMHEDDREMINQEVNNCVEGRDELFEVEFRLRCKDGSYKWIHARGQVASYREDGMASRLTGSHEDITFRRRNQEIQHALVNISNAVNSTKNLDELYEKIREHLGSVVDTTNCFLAIYHPENKTLSLPFLRDEVDSFTEFPAGNTLTGYVISTGKAQLVDADEEKRLTELGLIEPVGSPCVSWLGVPLVADTKIIGVFVVQSYTEGVKYTQEDVSILEFVSDQIALAIERKRDQDNIRESQERQRRIFESSPDPIVVVDANGFVIDYNTTLLDTLKVSNEPIMGQRIFHFISKKFWRVALGAFDRTWAEGYIKNLQFEVVRADGRLFESEVSTGAIYDQEGKPESMVIIFKDITDRKLVERSLMEAKEQAEESDRLKTAFLSNMSHEIRTPMNAIVGFSDLLNDKNLSDEDRHEFISQINLGADNLMHLIDDIIDISKIEAGQIIINKSRCSIRDLMNEQLVMFRQNLMRLDKENVELQLNWKLDSENLILKTDPFRIKQIISNLLNNAIKFTEQGYVELGLEYIENNFIRFYVKDTGVGIDSDKQSVIFDRFMQGHLSKTKLYGGTGLGLAICKNLVGLLGGEIGVISEEGNGAEFWFTLPSSDSKTDIKSSQPKKISVSENWQGRKILVAEDDTSNFNLISEVLKSTNVELIWAKDGNEAIDLFIEHEKELSLVLMDIRLPYKDGYECTRTIKQRNPELPVIAQTAYAMSGERDLSLQAGCDDYISKPLQVNSLIKVLGSYLK